VKLGILSAAVVGGFMAATASAALATPTAIGTVETFDTSVGLQPSNVGIITLTQVSATSGLVNVDLITTSKTTGYGILNTGGPHTPFAFQLDPSVLNGLSITHWDTPTDGIAPKGTFTLDTGGGAATPFGTFNTALVYSGGKGSGKAYYGDLKFTLSRTAGLDIGEFITNGTGWFAADLTNGKMTTGSQAWEVIGSITPPRHVPEPLTISLVAAGLVGAAAVRGRKKALKA
jgi:hypothetical protein